VEAKARERELDANGLLEQRQLHSVPVLQKIEALLLANIHVVLPGSLLGKALHYMSSQWSKLKLYVTSGAYPIDNNACENSIRPFVIGRRAWLFADTVGGANASANLYSLTDDGTNWCLHSSCDLPYGFLFDKCSRPVDGLPQQLLNIFRGTWAMVAGLKLTT
jgi:hypothetical protein